LAEQLQKDLNLSEAQIAKVKTILEEQKTEMEKLINALEDAHTAIMKKKKETEERIADVLDGMQKEKFEEIQKHRHDGPDERRDGRGQPRMPQADLPPMPGPISPEEQVERLKEELNLTDAQAVKVKAIFDEQKKEMQKSCEAAQDDPSVMHEKMKKIDERIAALLNDKQKEKFAEMQKQHGRRFDERPEHGEYGVLYIQKLVLIKREFVMDYVGTGHDALAK
jgi:Spy/CpxP family protein refolding chaperone